MNRHVVDRWWRVAYQRVVISSFRTVPFYRERWALSGRTDPVLVAGRHGVHGGAVRTTDVLRRSAELVPLSGGGARLDPHRGLGPVLAMRTPPGDTGVAVVLDKMDVLPPVDLPRGLRGCVLDPDSEPAGGTLLAITNALRRGVSVVAVGDDKQLAGLAALLPDDLAVRLDPLPRRALGELDGGPDGLLHDDVLGHLGRFGHCGRWHLDWRRVHARVTDGGLAFTLLRQRSPRLVDVLAGGGVAGAVEPCPRHGTPVVLT